MSFTTRKEKYQISLKQIGKSLMNYAILNSHLKKKFQIGKSCTNYNVPINRFEELVEYI